jgi:hypothetical protein
LENGAEFWNFGDISHPQVQDPKYSDVGKLHEIPHFKLATYSFQTQKIGIIIIKYLKNIEEGWP